MMPFVRVPAAILGIAALSAVAGHSSPALPRARTQATLTVFAAASLTDAFHELGRSLERARPGLTVQFNFAGSQQLALQLEQGAPADVFASADQRWMDYAAEKGLLTGERGIFARNRLVAIVPRTNPAHIDDLTDLARPGLKIVMAAAAVPIGRYSRQMLGRLAQAPNFPAEYERLVLANLVSEEENVKAVVAKVQLGEADAGIVYRSDVTSPVARRVRVFDINDPYNVVASYPIAALKGAKNAQAAAWFLDLVSSTAGQATLRRHGFMPAG
jgi:molybdate transport system substrate-binding protein